MKLMVWLLSLALLLTPLQPTVAHIPPVPEWPVIGPLLVKLGLVEPVRYPDPTLQEYRVTTMEELESLGDRVPAGERVRIIVAETLAQSLVEEALDKVELFQSFSFDFTERGMLLTVEIERAALERQGARIPPFIKGTRFTIGARVLFYAQDGYPQVKIRNVRVNNMPLPLGGLVQDRLNELARDEWPDWVTLEAVFMSDTEVAIEGYYVEH